MTQNRRLFLFAACTVSALLLTSMSGCGFHLRGSTPASQISFDSVYLEATKGTPLERELRRSILSQSNTTLASDQKTAAVTLRILSEVQERKILTLNAQGQVREYSLIYRINFEAADKENKKLLPANELALQAFLSYSESQALAKETEERMTYDDLRRDAVSQIMRQLSRIKPEQ
jgi:LPS-assembly lipoprotein